MRVLYIQSRLYQARIPIKKVNEKPNDLSNILCFSTMKLCTVHIKTYKLWAVRNELI